MASLEGELEALQADLATRMEALEVQVTRAEEAEAALEVGRVRQAELEKEIEQVTYEIVGLKRRKFVEYRIGFMVDDVVFVMCL